MNIDTDDLKTIRAAAYDEDTDMLRLVIVCQPADLPTAADTAVAVDGSMAQELYGLGRRIAKVLGK
jgi:hypothetical protein